MPIRFSKRIRIGKGFHINLSKSGIGFSQSIGNVTLGSKRNTVNIPGTGVSLYQNHKTGTSSNALPATTQRTSPTDDYNLPAPIIKKKSTNTMAWVAMIAIFGVVMCAILSIAAFITVGPGGVLGSSTIVAKTGTPNIQPVVLPTYSASSISTPRPTQPEGPTSRPYPSPSVTMIPLPTKSQGIVVEASITPISTSTISAAIIVPPVINPPASSGGGSASGPTAQCRDGTYSYAASHQGACSRHGGVAKWFR